MTLENQSVEDDRFGAHWVLATVGGGLILLLGAILLILPVGSRASFAQTAGWLLMAAGAIELFVGIKSGASIDGRITTLLSGVTLAAALVVLFRPDAYPLIFIAILCLAVRGIGALIAAFIGRDGVQPWVLARGVVDSALAVILIGGAPLSAVISVLSGRRWPPSGHALLGNFIAWSMVAAGICLIGVALSKRTGRNGKPGSGTS
jgi:uncharacterized membrane protein HdeD (DUF308 family)